VRVVNTDERVTSRTGESTTTFRFGSWTERSPSSVRTKSRDVASPGRGIRRAAHVVRSHDRPAGDLLLQLRGDDEQSPTTPKSAISKIDASASLFTATIVFDVCIPARCWIAPEMPRAM
jgi:hypothetical protein